MFDSIYGPQILSVLQDIYTLLSSLAVDVKYILQALVFFGLLFTAFKFISKRWLVLNG